MREKTHGPNQVLVAAVLLDPEQARPGGWYYPEDIAEATDLTQAQVKRALYHMRLEYEAIRELSCGAVRFTEDGYARWAAFQREYHPHRLYRLERHPELRGVA